MSRESSSVFSVPLPPPWFRTTPVCSLCWSNWSSCFVLRCYHALCCSIRTLPKTELMAELEHLGFVSTASQDLALKMFCPKFWFRRKSLYHPLRPGAIPSRSCTCPHSWLPVLWVLIFQYVCWQHSLVCVTACLNAWWVMYMCMDICLCNWMHSQPPIQRWYLDHKQICIYWMCVYVYI